MTLPNFSGNNTSVRKYSLPVHKGQGLLSTSFAHFDKPAEPGLLSPGSMSEIRTAQRRPPVARRVPLCTLENDTCSFEMLSLQCTNAALSGYVTAMRRKILIIILPNCDVDCVNCAPLHMTSCAVCNLHNRLWRYWTQEQNKDGKVRHRPWETSCNGRGHYT